MFDVSANMINGLLGSAQRKLGIVGLTLRDFRLAASDSEVAVELERRCRHITIALFPQLESEIEVLSPLRRLIDQRIIDQPALLTLSPREFEELIAEIWHRLGYTVELTARTRDGGRDIVAVRCAETAVRYLIECKRYDPKYKVGIAIVRALYGVRVHEGATKAILATTSTFSRDALQFCGVHRWELEPRDYRGVLEWSRMAAGFARSPSHDLWLPRTVKSDPTQS